MARENANLKESLWAYAGLYGHPKTSGRYEVIYPGPAGAAINATNGPNNGQRMVVYRSLSDYQLYVREESEFVEPGRFVRLE